MTRIIVTPEAIATLERLIVSHSLPADSKERFRRSIEPLGTDRSSTAATVFRR